MKMRLLPLFASFALLTLLVGCQAASDSKELGTRFYEDLKAGKYADITSLVDPEVLQTSPAAQWENVLRTREAQVGKLNDWNNNGIKTQTKNGVNLTRLRYTVDNAGKKTHELLTFRQRGDGAPRLYNYMYNENSAPIDEAYEQELN